MIKKLEIHECANEGSIATGIFLQNDEICAFNALTLLVMCVEEPPSHKIDFDRCWWGYLSWSEVQITCVWSS